MKMRDRRVALTNEMLGAIRMLKVNFFSDFARGALTMVITLHYSSWLGNAASKSVSLPFVRKSSPISSVIITLRHCGMQSRKSFIFVFTAIF